MSRVLRRSFGFRRRYSNNVVLRFGGDGVELVRKRTNRRWLPLWHVIFFVYMALLIRLVIMADMGPGSYTARMAELENGTMIDKVAARVMAMDPVSEALARRLRASLISIRENVFEREVWQG